MNGSVLLAGTVLLSLTTAAPVLAGGGWEHGGGQYRGGGWCRLALCPCCRGPHSIYRHHPALDYHAAYYTSPRGVGPGHSTTAYSPDGRAHRLKN
jgi:hypothetical protein